MSMVNQNKVFGRTKEKLQKCFIYEGLKSHLILLQNLSLAFPAILKTSELQLAI